jgi:myo-inositol-1(or 4)-monophosphatase
MMQPTISEMENWARTAGKLLKDGLGQQIQVDLKGEIDLVTEMDRRSESYLLDQIQEKYPHHQIIAEESGVIAGEASRVWHIDPLDGTVNYAHGIPIWSVSLGFVEDGQVVLGVVYDPMREELYSAQRGQGAYLNGHPIRVSPADTLKASLLVTGFPYDTWHNPENNLDHYANFTKCTQGVRRLGSAAIDLCYVAAGRLEGFWEVRIQSYDIAAGALILEEAGGKVTDIQGGSDFLVKPCSILASNGQIHDQMLKVLRNGME